MKIFMLTVMAMLMTAACGSKSKQKAVTAGPASVAENQSAVVPATLPTPKAVTGSTTTANFSAVFESNMPGSGSNWVTNNPDTDGVSCPNTCARANLSAIVTGTITYPSTGDPALYLCKAFLPGSETFGERAGYNWNGNIGTNIQPGCVVVGGEKGFTFVKTFNCFCSPNH